jgi:hypothetical protein
MSWASCWVLFGAALKIEANKIPERQRSARTIMIIVRPDAAWAASRNVFIRFGGFGQNHAREREASCMIEAMRAQCRAFFS